jgi:hypothetical protein
MFKIFKYLKILVLFVFTPFILSFSLDIKKSGFFIKDNKDGTYTLHINLNYENLSQKIVKLEDLKSYFIFSFPFPKRYIPLRAKLHLVYYVSPIVLEKRSLIDISLNGKDIYVERLKPSKGIKNLDISVPIKYFNRYNKLTIEAIHHYTFSTFCEDVPAPELWTKIFLDKSYLEITFTYKLIPNTLEALQVYVHDPSNIYKKNLNIVVDFDNLNKKYLNNLAILVGFLAKIYKYADININITNKPVPNGDNYILGTREFIRRILHENTNGYNIFITDNKANPFFKNIVLTGDSLDDIKNALIALFMGKVNLLKQQGVKVLYTTSIPKLGPYQGIGFLPLGRRVYFKDLGIKTVTLHSKQVLRIPYKIYPDTLFGDKDKVKVHLDLVLPSLVREDSSLNIFGEGVGKKIFLLQVPVKKALNKSIEYYFYANILPKGNGYIVIEPNLIPLVNKPCEPRDEKNLMITIGDTSYIEFPKGIHITEMPYLEFFGNNAYPYSIYADLQDTTVIVTHRNKNLLSAALKIIYFISQRTQYPPFFVNLIWASETNTTDLQKNIIVVGSYNEILKDIFAKGAISILDEHTLKYRERLYNDYADKQIKKFIELAIRGIYTPIMVEMFESPYKKGKTVMVVYSNNEKDLLEFVNYLFSLKGAYWFKGDTILYAPEEGEIFNYNLNDKYIVGKASLITKIKYNLAIHPQKYIIAIVIGAGALAVIILILLDLFKRRHHRDAE